MRRDTLLKGRFEIVDDVGHGGQGKTYLAEDRETGRRVIVKELQLAHAEDAKAIELFEREADILSTLDHGGIPSYVDYFIEGEEGDQPRFFLVQAYVEGPTLLDEIEGGRRFSEEGVRDLAARLLQILVYLQERHPPVLHRDIKPANIIVRPDGKLALVDFGAAQTVLRETMSASTVVGTTGYMAPEQFTGRAVPASDLYSVGATLIHVLSHRHPGDLPMERLRVAFHDYVSASSELVAFIDRLTEPALENRFPNARQALDVLRREGAIFEYEPEPLHEMMTRMGPRDTAVKMHRTPRRLQIEIPGNPRPKMLVVEGAATALAGLLLLAAFVSFGGLAQLMALPLMLVFYGFYQELKRLRSYDVDVTDRGYEITEGRLMGKKFYSGELTPHTRVREAPAGQLLPGSFNQKMRIEFVEGERWVRAVFGEYLSGREREWILTELREFLTEIGHSDPGAVELDLDGQSDAMATDEIALESGEEATEEKEIPVPEHIIE